MARGIKVGIKRRETDPASNQFPKCSPQSRTHKEIQSWVEKRMGREEIEAASWSKRRAEVGESKLPVITSLCALHSLDPSETFTELHREEKREN